MAMQVTLELAIESGHVEQHARVLTVLERYVPKDSTSWDWLSGCAADFSRENLTGRVLRYMARHCSCLCDAMTSRELCEAMVCADSELRGVVHELRMRRLPICSSTGHGYWLGTHEEIVKSRNSLYGRVGSIARAALAMAKASQHTDPIAVRLEGIVAELAEHGYCERGGRGDCTSGDRGADEMRGGEDLAGAAQADADNGDDGLDGSSRPAA
jgi:uncharacterized low-complexity protein